MPARAKMQATYPHSPYSFRGVNRMIRAIGNQMLPSRAALGDRLNERAGVGAHNANVNVDGTERRCLRGLDRRRRDNLESSTPAREARVRPHAGVQLLGPLGCLESQRQAL